MHKKCMVVTHTHSLSLARALSLSLADGGGGQRCSRLSLRCLLDNSSSETFGNLDYGRLYSAGARFVPLCDGTIKTIVTTRAKYQAWNRTTESFLHCCSMVLPNEKIGLRRRWRTLYRPHHHHLRFRNSIFAPRDEKEKKKEALVQDQ